ncbi:MAG TPA: hypothetical protein VIM57_08640 [Luteolibacter sp.]
MPFPSKPLIVLAALLAAGVPRVWFEDGLSRELHDARLLVRPVSVSTREKIDQTSWAVALGGLRTLVATFLNLRAHEFFEETRWDELGEEYDKIVDFAPNTRDYWLTGAWHQSNNASSYYAYDSDLPALRRKAEWRASIQRGREFLERGVRNNPGDWKLEAGLGNLLADTHRLPDFSAAADAFGAAVADGSPLSSVRRNQFYALARVAGREDEARKLGRKLYTDRTNRTPMLMSVLFALESRTKPATSADDRAVQLFGDEKAAYSALSHLWSRPDDRYPVDGVAEALAGLERRLAIPPGESVFWRTSNGSARSRDPFAR